MKVVEVMESEIQVFEHPVFGKMHVVMIENNPRFFAIDTCRALEIKNPRDAVSRLNDDEKCSIIIVKNGVTNSVGNINNSNSATSGWLENRVNVINEPGLYRLIFTSRKPEAKEFQHWVYHEVLPTIRKYGLYSTEQIIMQLLKSAIAAELVYKCVYFLEMSNGTTKIGSTQEFLRRMRQIETGSGLTAVNHFHTKKFPEKLARQLEKTYQQFFADKHILGEFFDITLEEALAALKIISYNERSEKTFGNRGQDDRNE